MSTQFLVITSVNSWGRGETEREAVSNAAANAYRDVKEFSFTLYHFPPVFVSEFYVDGMGGVNWTWTEQLMDLPARSQDLIRRSLKVGHFRRDKRGNYKREEVKAA